MPLHRCCPKSNTTPKLKDKILKAKDIDTVIPASVVEYPVRAIKNKLATEYNQAEKISWLVRRLRSEAGGVPS